MDNTYLQSLFKHWDFFSSVGLVKVVLALGLKLNGMATGCTCNTRFELVILLGVFS